MYWRLDCADATNFSGHYRTGALSICIVCCVLHLYGFYDALETVADDTAEKASPEEVSEDQPMEEVAQVVESSDSSSDSDTS